MVEPRLHVVRQYAWRGGVAHRELYPVILPLVRERWRCRAVVVDATGVGSGLTAFLGAALGSRIVRPYVYTAASKSKLAYDFLGAVNAGRVRAYEAAGVLRQAQDERQAAEDQQDQDELLWELMRQAGEARYELRAGQVMRWGVPEHMGHPSAGSGQALLNALVLCVQAGPMEARRVAVGRRADG